ncbi:MAG: hypothetical protein GC204_16950 [Chloroflexi bacterium]|nr:hypothetical protein [Chloroflexota bacterium]
MMLKNPLQNIEAIENVALVLLGVILLFTLEPVSSTQLILATILAVLLIGMVAIDVWQWRHQR